MRLNIAPKNHESLNCQEVLLLSVAEWWERGHVLMFTESWGFTYTPYDAENPEIFGKRFGSNDVNWRSNLGLYHGVQTALWDKEKTAAEIIRIAEEELAQQRPLAIIMDYFWCPWVEEYYQKYHGGAGGLPHTCMIVGLEGDNIVCIDPTFAPTEQVLLPLDHFEQGCGGHMRVWLADEPAWPNWRDVLARSVAYLGEGEANAFYQIRLFADEMEKYVDISKEKEGFENKPGYSPIVFKLKLIGFGRKKAAMLLTELGNRHDVPTLLDFAAKLEECAAKWDRMSLSMMKALYTKKPAGPLANVVNAIREVASMEEQLAQDLKQFLGQQS